MRLLFVLIFVSGCASVSDNIAKKNFTASFKTTLSAEDFVVCMNANRKYIFTWLPPAKYTETKEIIYPVDPLEGTAHRVLYENGVVEFYENSFNLPLLKNAAENFQKFCS